MMHSRILNQLTWVLSSTVIAGAFVGMTQSMAFGAATPTTDEHVPTFSKDIAPIFQAHCQSCHHQDSIAPMALMTYKDAKPWASAIKSKVATRTMPPWYIDKNVGVQKFKDDPSLSDAQIATIVNWADHGAPEGNPADMPPAKTFLPGVQWQFKPDMVVSMSKPFVLPAGGGDQYYDINVDPHFTRDMYVQEIQTRPTMGFKVVHHFDTNIIEDTSDPVGLFLSEYAVGKGADVYPSTTARVIKAGSIIHFQIHMHPDGQATPVSVELGLKLYPAGTVPKYIALTQHMGDHSTSLDIPAGQMARTDGYFLLPKPAVLTAFQPHYHTLGKAMCLEAIFPQVRTDSARPGPARTQTISCVSDYRFGWSISYPYAEDVEPLLPAGTVMHVTTWHDNTASNTHDVNPMNFVGDGQRTNDEMGFAWVSLYYIDQADYNQRVAARKAHGGSAHE